MCVCVCVCVCVCARARAGLCHPCTLLAKRHGQHVPYVMSCVSLFRTFTKTEHVRRYWDWVLGALYWDQVYIVLYCILCCRPRYIVL